MSDGVVQRPDFSVFSKHVGEEFTCKAGEIIVHLVLESAESLREDENGVVKAFSLLFHLKEDADFQQGNLPLQHKDLGETNLFLVNLGPHKSGNGFRLEAIFN